MFPPLQLPEMKKLEDIDFQEIIMDFNQQRERTRKLPRVAFIGLFQYLSMTRQREICQHIGFEYFSEIEMATADEKKMAILQGKWSDITKSFTRLIVIGNHYDRGPAWEVEHYLYKKYKDHPDPVFEEHQIPCIMEEELFKLNWEYPNINMNTRWEGNMRWPECCKSLPTCLPSTSSSKA